MCPFALFFYLMGFLQLTSGLQRALVPQRAAAQTCWSSSGASAVTALQRSRRAVCMVPPEAAVAEAAPVEAVQQQGKKKKDKKKKERTIKVHGQPIVIGLSHKTATVEVRERLSILEAEWNEAAAALTAYDSIDEAAILSTCNRFEVYISAADHYEATKDVMDFLRKHSGLDDAELRPNLFVLQNEDATWHLLRVSSGLDSLVVGEGQILSQVKACYSHAISNGNDDEEKGALEPPGSAGKVLGRLLNSAVMAGKWVRSETEIAKGAVSISSAAVELAILKAPLDVGKPISEARVAIIGAGKMSRLLLTHLASHGVTKVSLLNRSRPRAEELAAEYPDLDIHVGLMDELWPVLHASDLAFTSTSATGCIVTQPLLEEHGVGGAAGEGKLMLVDISVPRNVESECNDVEGVVAYNVDDLKQVVARNQARRKHKVLEAEALLRVELAKFVSWQESLKFVPAISQLQASYESVREAELAKASKKGLKDLTDKQRQAVDVATKQIINKLLHGPMAYLRSDDADGTKASLQQVKQIFKLDD